MIPIIRGMGRPVSEARPRSDRRISRRRPAWRARDRWLAAAVLIAGLALGYGLAWAGGLRAVRLPAKVGDESFSEAEALKQDLVELCLRQMHALRDAPTGEAEVDSVHRLRTDAVAVARVRSLIAEYAGTASEADLTQVLMIMLWRSGELALWLDEYFGMVYRHPTWASVGADWHRAGEVACGLGRMDEWLRARAFLRAIPATMIDDVYRPEDLRRGMGGP